MWREFGFLEQQLGYYKTAFRLTINLMRHFATSPNAASVRHWLKHKCVKFSAACLSIAVQYHCGPSCSLPERLSTIAALPAACLSSYLPLRPFLQPA